MREFLAQLLDRLHSEEADLMKRINEEGQLADEDEKKLADAISEFVDDFGPDFDEEGEPLEEGESDRIHSEEEHEKPARTEAESDDEGDEGEEDAEAAESEEKEAAPA